MEMYKKPIMKIVELEKVDVLTASGTCQYGCGYTGTGLTTHEAGCANNPANQSQP